MMSLPTASIEGPRAYWTPTCSMRRECLMAWISSDWVRPWRLAFQWSHWDRLVSQSERDALPSPYSSRIVFSIRLLVVWKADKEGFLELAPFLNEATLEKLGPADDPGLELLKASKLRVVGAVAVSEFWEAVFEVAVQSF